MLNEDERDAISEILNIAIGQAARALSEMVDEEVKLSVPSIESLSVQEACDRVDRHTGRAGSAVRESFSGPFEGDMLLIFPEDQSLELVRRLIGETTEVESITDLEQDALMEVGNVIMTSCLSTMADTLGLSFTNTSLPEILRGTGSDILVANRGEGYKDGFVLFLEVDFKLQSSDISGYVLIALGLPSARLFKEIVNKYLEELMA